MTIPISWDSEESSEAIRKETGVTWHRVCWIAAKVGVTDTDQLRAWILQHEDALRALKVASASTPNFGAKTCEKLVQWAGAGFDPRASALQARVRRLRKELRETKAELTALK